MACLSLFPPSTVFYASQELQDANKQSKKTSIQDREASGPLSDSKLMNQS